MAGYVVQFAWGWVVLAAFVGWGIVAGRLSGLSRALPAGRPDWGLAAGWGMALVLAAGGLLSLFGLARPAALVALVLAGALAFAWDSGKQRRPAGGDEKARWPWWLLAVVAVALVLRYAGAVRYQALSCADDNVAYFAFVARLLDTGSLIEPFSFRRLSAFGGQTFLQALTVATGSMANAYLVDRGVAFVVAFGLVLGLFKDRDGRPAVPAMAALLLVLALPFPLLNSSSHVTGLALFLTLCRTLALAPPIATTPARGPWLVGGVAAATASLKASFVPAAAVAVLAFWLIAIVREKPGRRPAARWLGHVALSGVAFLVPWMALLWRSSGTPFFPLFNGVHRPAFAATYAGALPAEALAAHVAGFLAQPRVALLLLPLVLYAVRRGPAAGLALYAGAVAASLIVAVTLSFDTPEMLYRYAAPFLNAAFMATVAAYLDDLLGRLPPAATTTGRARAGMAALALAALATLAVPAHRDLRRVLDKWDATVIRPDQRAVYARAQSAVPAGRRMLVAVGHPFAFDFRRNDVVNVDVPGAASPDPGMPFFKGPAALRDYLLGQSIDHVVVRDFDRPGGCLYYRDGWRQLAQGDNPMWRAQSKYYLDLMDNLTVIAGMGRVLHRERGLTAAALR